MKKKKMKKKRNNKIKYKIKKLYLKNNFIELI